MVISFRLTVAYEQPFCVPFISPLKHFSTKTENFFLLSRRHRVLNNFCPKLYSQHYFQICLAWNWNWALVHNEQVMQEHPLDKAKSEIISSSSFLQIILADSLYCFELACFTELFCFSWEMSMSTCVEGQEGGEKRCYSCSLHTDTW